jgi:SAM-dependent methyltransferase
LSFNLNKNRTIKDFGEQWLRYSDSKGYYGSLELFSDILSPFLKPEEIKDCRVADIGSGTGRIVNMLLEAGVRHVIALEPSEAFEVLCKNVREPERVTCLKTTGDRLPAYGNLDYIFSIGVLHHIPEPAPVVKAAFKALRPGGNLLIWLYGKEGNELYLSFVKPLRMITKRLPHFILSALVWTIYIPTAFYIKLCHKIPLPLQEYFFFVFEKMSPKHQRLIIYDQLNPFYAKYYTRSEAEKLLIEGKFINVRSRHHHGYSWTVIGAKP